MMSLLNAVNEASADDVEAALLVFAERAGLDVQADGAAHIASSMLANILHWVTIRRSQEEALDTVRKGISHFVSELTYPFGEADAWVRIKVECGGEVWHSQTGLGTTVIKEPS
jgi:hypothetical protein